MRLVVDTNVLVSAFLWEGTRGRLIELGLIERRADQRVAVAWDIVSAEMRLAA